MRPFYNEEQLTVGDETLTLVLNFRALDCIESLTGETMPAILPQLVGDPPYSLVGKVLWGLLREKHEGVSLDEAAGVAFGDEGAKVGLAIGTLLQRGFNLGEAKGENPPKRRGRSKISEKNTLQPA
jgi:hypothetical protein